jgi:hypothetical protein
MRSSLLSVMQFERPQSMSLVLEGIVRRLLYLNQEANRIVVDKSEELVSRRQHSFTY